MTGQCDRERKREPNVTRKITKKGVSWRRDDDKTSLTRRQVGGFYTALFRARPGQLLVFRICEEGSHENRPEKVALVVLSTIYVSDEHFLYERMMPRFPDMGFVKGLAIPDENFEIKLEG